MTKSNRRTRGTKNSYSPSRSLFCIGDLVEHADYTGYRGIINEVVKTRTSTGHPRVVSVMWFPPTSIAMPPTRWKIQDVSGTTHTSVLNLVQVSSIVSR